MRTLVTPEGMYALEKRYFASGTPSIVLMRRAADRLAEAFETHFGAFAGNHRRGLRTRQQRRRRLRVLRARGQSGRARHTADRLR